MPYLYTQIQLRALTEHGTFTEWTKGFALNAVGTSGNYTAKLGEQQYKVLTIISL